MHSFRLSQIALSIWLALASVPFLEPACAPCTSTPQGPSPACALTKAAVGTDAASTKDEDKGRTGNSLFPVQFAHDGGSSTFSVKLDLTGSDSSIAVQESDCAGTVTAIFNKSGEKVVKVNVTQSSTGRNQVSANSLKIVYDKIPPVLTINRVKIGDANATPVVYSAGTTYYVSSTGLILEARVNDPAPSQKPDKLSMRLVEGLGQPGAFQKPKANTSDGSFDFIIDSIAADGEYNLKIRAYDSDKETFEDDSLANFSEPAVLKVIRDGTAPVLLKVEVIKSLPVSTGGTGGTAGTGNAAQAQTVTQEAPGVFVRGGDPLRIRCTFSEELKVPPTLTLTHKGSGSGTPPQAYNAPFDTQLFATSKNIVEYLITPLFDLTAIGQVDFAFGGGGSGGGTGTGSVEQVAGSDLAGNPVDKTKGALKTGGKIDRAIIVDSTPPDLNRIDPTKPSEVQSIPKNNEVLGKKNFPKQITLFVKDYNLPKNANTSESANATANTDSSNASGVDFDKVGTELKVELIGPDGKALPGTLVTQPPNGLIYILPSAETLFPGNAAEPATIGSPPEGIYQVKVTLIDKVGNKASESIAFTMDTNPVAAGSMQVKLLPDSVVGAITPDAGNPLIKNPIKGDQIPETPNLKDLGTLDSVRELKDLEICSTDPTFSLTNSLITFKARLNGPDTNARLMNVSGTPDFTSTANTCKSQGFVKYTVLEDQKASFPNLLFEWPNPKSIPNNVLPGKKDPRFGQFDGPYLVEISAADKAGNITTTPIKKEFLLDTNIPYTDTTFPLSNGKINTPLRHVSAVVVDPAPARNLTFEQNGKVNFGSGISVSNTKITAKLKVPYAATVDSNIFDTNDGNRVRGTLNFTHNPNSFDPTLATFNPNDDLYRVLLEFVDAQAKTTSLPVDGSADGIYELEVIPMDNAGNTVKSPKTSGWSDNGLAEEKKPKELRSIFKFLLDTRPPNFTLDTVPGTGLVPTELNVNGRSFGLTGKVRDLSAKLAPEAIKGGAGVDRVEYSVVLLTVDGELVAPEAPPTNTTGQAPTAKFKPNPIIDKKIATLSAYSGPSVDPSVDATRPLTDAYAAIIMEERNWTIQDQLPPADELIVQGAKKANYVMILRAYDLAGNFNEKRLVMNLSLGLLPPPDLVFPLPNQKLKSPAVNFEWKPVPGAQDYILHLSHPSGETTTYSVVKSSDSPTVKWNQVLSKEGAYEWYVLSRDSVGNIGDKGFIQKFHLDKTNPLVELLSWSDLTPESKGRLGIGTFRLVISFNEEIKVSPKVTFDPFDPSVPPQTITSTKLIGKLWEGIATIPTTATNLWDGKATIEISGAQDFASNIMLVNRNYDFQIDTGPTYAVKFFENPVFQSELILLVRTTEKLLASPVLSNPSGVNFVNSAMLRINDTSYSAVMKLSGGSPRIGAVDISGQDLDGNAATRRVTFPLNVVTQNTGTTLNASRMSLELRSGSVAEDRLVAILPRSEFLEDASTRTALAKSVAKIPVATGPELKKVQDLELVIPGDLNLLIPAKANLLLDQPLGPKQGIYLLSNNGVALLSLASGERLQFDLPAFGQIGVYEDILPPKIVLDKEIEEGGVGYKSPQVSFTLSDQGSGLATESIRVHLGELELGLQETSQNRYVYRSAASVSVTKADLSIEALDRSGNKAVLQAVLAVNLPISLNAVSFPNPARSFANIQYDLSRPAVEIGLTILDSSGRTVLRVASSQDPSLVLNAGRNTWRWDLTNQKAQKVKNGVYFCKILVRDSEGNTSRQNLKLAVLQ